MKSPVGTDSGGEDCGAAAAENIPMKILHASQMQEVDRLTTEVYQIPSILLMENAGRSVADELERACVPLAGKRILILCGKGNNGGDGLVVARYLALRGLPAQALLLADPSDLKGDALANWRMAHALGLDVLHSLTAGDALRLLRRGPAPDVFVDALFGTGLSKPLTGAYKSLVEWINRLGERSLVLSVDIPSGLMADSPLLSGPSVRAQVTVTFTAPKPALVLDPAAARAGRVVVAPIGSPAALVESDAHRWELVDASLIASSIPKRRRDSHKGHYGHVHILAGSRDKSGAALMTGLAALRAGAGLVTLWLPESLRRDAVGRVPELMTEWIAETDRGGADIAALDRLLAGSREMDVMVIGPGMGTHGSTGALVRELARRSPVPVVLDADGLNAFAGRSHELHNDAGAPVVITPHPGEMARLAGTSIAEVQKHRAETALEFSRERGCFTILKGHQTLLATPAGDLLVNPTGNPGMATGGSGDILAGLVGRFVAGWFRKFRGTDQSALANHLAASVYLHGLAGDLAADEVGEESLIATDLLGQLPAAFRKVKRDAARD